jgi:cyclopropane fatty-acyl-phospholipid synthase-like methyltransferase
VGREDDAGEGRGLSAELVAARWDSETPFDYLVAIQVFQHGAQPDTESYFARTAAVLKAGGLFFLRVNSAKGPRAGSARKS